MKISFPLIIFVLASVISCSLQAASAPRTFCNPLNLDHGLNGRTYRHSADPVIVLFKDKYYLFATDDVSGFRVSEDLLTWRTVLFPREQLSQFTDGEFYCAPAAVVSGDYLYFMKMARAKANNPVPIMRSRDPESGLWEQCGQVRSTKDPAIFIDDDGRTWLYHGLGQPTKVFELKNWREVPGSEVQLRPAATNLAAMPGGFERGRREILDEVDTESWLKRFEILPCQEAAWVTKRSGRYYLQYATPGTVTQWYCDIGLEGSSPTGPFSLANYSPVSMKIGGFIGSAGHSSVFQDKYGNWWRATTMWIGVHHLFERRLGLFPVNFDAEGRMFTETWLGDYPQVLPDGPRDPQRSLLAGWVVLSCGKKMEASSSLEQHAPGLAADENVRTWWSAATGNAGEWLTMDLGRNSEVAAIQLNFAEQDCQPSKASPAEPHQYRLLISKDARTWELLIDQSRNLMAVPHDYHALAATRQARYLKVENVSSAAGGKFAVRDLRVFGPPTGRPPGQPRITEVARHEDDDRNVTVRWKPVPGADGYLVRFGIAPDKLWQAIQLQGQAQSKLTLHCLIRGQKYAWRVDAFGSGGVTAGRVFPAD